MVPSSVDSPGFAPLPRALRLVLRAGIAALGLALWLEPTDAAAAQTDLPPDKGGKTYELGMPPVYKGNAGFMMGSYRPSGVSDLSVMAHFGIQKDLLSPVIGIAALQVEGSIGRTGRELNGGGRLLFKIPSLHFSLGPDYDVESDGVDLLLRLELATRRSGIFGRATMLRIDYIVPLWGKNLGKTRPRRDAVKLATRPLGRIEQDQVSPALDESLTRVEEDAHWITLLSMPFDDQGGKDPQEAYADQILYLKTFLDSTSPRFPNGQNFNELIRVYHQELDRTFSIATSGRDVAEGASTPEGRAASTTARRILMDDVVFATPSGSPNTPDCPGSGGVMSSTPSSGWWTSPRPPGWSRRSGGRIPVSSGFRSNSAFVPVNTIPRTSWMPSSGARWARTSSEATTSGT